MNYKERSKKLTSSMAAEIIKLKQDLKELTSIYESIDEDDYTKESKGTKTKLFMDTGNDTATESQKETVCDYTVGIKVTNVQTGESHTYKSLNEAFHKTGISLYSLSVLSRSGNLWRNILKIERVNGEDHGMQAPTVKIIKVESDDGQVIVSDEMNKVAEALGVEYSTLSRAIKKGYLANTSLGFVNLSRMTSEQLDAFKEDVKGYDSQTLDEDDPIDLRDYDL